MADARAGAGSGGTDEARLEDQLRFLIEIDRLKTVLRRTRLTDGSRRENSAEHSWHIALMAFLLAEHAPEGADIGRVVRMLLVHDLVEIDAGDTFAYDDAGNATRAERERVAADRIFGLLPPDQAIEMRGLWDEFEAGATPEARYAVALDRLQPLLQNLARNGGTWLDSGVTAEKVLDRMRPIGRASPVLWSYAEAAVVAFWARARRGLPPDPATPGT